MMMMMMMMMMIMIMIKTNIMILIRVLIKPQLIKHSIIFAEHDSSTYDYFYADRRRLCVR